MATFRRGDLRSFDDRAGAVAAYSSCSSSQSGASARVQGLLNAAAASTGAGAGAAQGLLNAAAATAPAAVPEVGARSRRVAR